MVISSLLKCLYSCIVIYFCILHSFVAPVIIRAASIWMLSKLEQLSHIVLAYSKKKEISFRCVENFLVFSEN